MTATITKWGNSQGIRLPKFLLENADMTENSIVDVSTEKDMIIIKKATPKTKAIEELFEGYEGTYEPVEIDWGVPVGKELW